MAARTPKRFLAIDIGGSGIKAAVLNRNGRMLTDRVRVKTPRSCPPEALLGSIVALVAPLAPFDRIAVGFPGVVRAGVIVTAPNLGTDLLAGLDLAAALRKRLRKPTRVANDAAVQGLGAIEGRGVEMVITLGTGLGSALFIDGRSLPNLELGHHPFHKGRTYEELLGDRALKKSGRKKWNETLARAIETMRALVNFDVLYIGGGNARHVRLKLNDDTRKISNTLGVKGGVALWLGPGRES
jgi:polyphosphate glucokinase